MKDVIKAVKRAVRNMVARYEVSAYAEGEAYEWGAHKCLTKKEALEWMGCYPQGALVVVWNRRWQMVACREPSGILTRKG